MSSPTDTGELCVVGLGLIGGSLMRAARDAGWTVRGTAASTADVEAARLTGYEATTKLDDALRRAADHDALVVLAVPLPALDEVLTSVARVAPRCLLTDVVSVKQPVARAVARRAPEARYVGGHPMAGTAESGWVAGSATLFKGAPWVVSTERDTDLALWTRVARLALDCGAKVVPAVATDHDAAAARVSHLPHLLAAVLAAVGADGGPLALALGAGSFADGTRVAGTVPALVEAMCEGNRWALLDAVDDALGRLGAARGSLASTGGLAATIRAGHEARKTFDAARERQRGTTHVNLDAAGALDRLREIGRAGGQVVAMHGNSCQIAL